MTPSKQVSGDSVVDVLRDTEKPYATTTDIAEGLDVTAQTIRNNAGELSQDPRINKGSVGQSSVYWLADSNSPPEGVAGDPGPPEPPDQRGATEPEPERDTNDSKGILNRLFDGLPALSASTGLLAVWTALVGLSFGVGLSTLFFAPPVGVALLAVWGLLVAALVALGVATVHELQTSTQQATIGADTA